MHAVFTQSLTGFAGAHNIWYKTWPFVWPILLEDLHQDEVELVEVDLGWVGEMSCVDNLCAPSNTPNTMGTHIPFADGMHHL